MTITTQSLELTTFDGLHQNVVVDSVDSAKAVVVISHGVGANVEKYQYANLARKLNEAGYTTYRYDQRGHGKSGGERVYLDDYRSLIRDVDAVMETARATANPGKKLFLFGNSMGGMTAAAFAIAHPQKADGIILSNAAVWGLQKTSREHDPKEKIFAGGEQARAKWEAEGDKGDFPYMTYGLKYQLEEGVTWIMENVQAFANPLLMVNGYMDPVIDWHNCLTFFENVKGVDKQFCLYGPSNHGLYYSSVQDEVIENTITWLNVRC